MRIACAVAAPFRILLQAPQGQGTSSRPSPSSISGVVVWKAEVRPKRKISVDSFYKGVAIEDERCLVGADGRLANAVVSLRPLEGQDLTKIPPQQTPASKEAPKSDGGDDRESAAEGSITMKDGMFRPRVQVVRVGESFALANEDATLVNFHWKPNLNAAFNLALPRPGRQVLGTARFRKPEVVTVGDDVHAWVVAYLVVVDGGEHRVTKDDGAFRFDGLPPGKYRLEVWHESGKKDSREIALEPGKPIKLEVELR